jgi:hypothetical protein
MRERLGGDGVAIPVAEVGVKCCGLLSTL